MIPQQSPTVTNDSVHIVSRDAEVRRSVIGVCQSHGLAWRAYQRVSQWLDETINGSSGCIVAEVSPPADGLLLIQQITNSRGCMVPVFLAQESSVSMAVEAMKRGACDFLLHPWTDDDLSRSLLDAVHQSRSLKQKHQLRNRVTSGLKLLSQRERQVLEMLFTGEPNKRIAHELHLSEKTITTHRKNILAKMGARSLVELVARLIEVGGIDSLLSSSKSEISE